MRRKSFTLKCRTDKSLENIQSETRRQIWSDYWGSDMHLVEIGYKYGIRANRVPTFSGPAYIDGYECVDCGDDIPVILKSELKALNPSKQKLCKTCEHAHRINAKIDAQLKADEERRVMFRRRQQLASMPYREYLLTNEWKETRGKALKRANYACQACGGKIHLQVHHRTYIRRGHEKDSDLMVLCDRCHSTFHKERWLSERGRANV